MSSQDKFARILNGIGKRVFRFNLRRLRRPLRWSTSSLQFASDFRFRLRGRLEYRQGATEGIFCSGRKLITLDLTFPIHLAGIAQSRGSGRLVKDRSFHSSDVILSLGRIVCRNTVAFLHHSKELVKLATGIYNFLRRILGIDLTDRSVEILWSLSAHYLLTRTVPANSNEAHLQKILRVLSARRAYDPHHQSSPLSSAKLAAYVRQKHRPREGDLHCNSGRPPSDSSLFVVTNLDYSTKACRYGIVRAQGLAAAVVQSRCVLFGFAKSARGNVSDDELATAQDIARLWLEADGKALAMALSEGIIQEVGDGKEEEKG
jgi:hypothetical protein